MVWYKTATEVETEKKESLFPQLTAERKRVEAEGITYNNIRYAGDIGNRQTIGEALDFAEDAGTLVFASWKGSDGVFHADVPVADVKEAYRLIGQRRSALIAKEAEYAAQVLAGTLASVNGLLWDV